mmetsp:Transcript_33862/g.66006  ORF Transcript_33862/g.66006 Transcript_33862/m.66006 type:complete len:204 (-) Transcript_33862:211-822(-)
MVNRCHQRRISSNPGAWRHAPDGEDNPRVAEELKGVSNQLAQMTSGAEAHIKARAAIVGVFVGELHQLAKRTDGVDDTIHHHNKLGEWHEQVLRHDRCGVSRRISSVPSGGAAETQPATINPCRLMKPVKKDSSTVGAMGLARAAFSSLVACGVGRGPRSLDDGGGLGSYSTFGWSCRDAAVQDDSQPSLVPGDTPRGPVRGL